MIWRIVRQKEKKKNPQALNEVWNKISGGGGGGRGWKSFCLIYYTVFLFLNCTSLILFY